MSKVVVIVGSGYTATAIANYLKLKFKIYMIVQNPFFINLIANPNCVVDSQVHSKNTKQFSEIFSKNDELTLIEGEIQPISSTSPSLITVETKTGLKDILYDYLVISTGCSQKNNHLFLNTSIPTFHLSKQSDCFALNQILENFNSKENNLINNNDNNLFLVNNGARNNHLDYSNDICDQNNKPEKKKRITIIGGGAAGVEVAAELCETYPHYLIQLVVSGDRILSHLSEEAHNIATHYFSKFSNMKIFFNSRVKGTNERGIITVNNEEIKTDLIILATGSSPNSQMLPDHCKDNQSRIQVNNYLQVDQLGENVFAGGDVCNVGYKLASTALKQAQIISSNILDLASGSSPSHLFTQKKWRTLILLGSSNGVMDNSGVASAASGDIVKMKRKRIFTADVLYSLMSS